MLQRADATCPGQTSSAPTALFLICSCRANILLRREQGEGELIGLTNGTISWVRTFDGDATVPTLTKSEKSRTELSRKAARHLEISVSPIFST